MFTLVRLGMVWFVGVNTACCTPASMSQVILALPLMRGQASSKEEGSVDVATSKALIGSQLDWFTVKTMQPQHFLVCFERQRRPASVNV